MVQADGSWPKDPPFWNMKASLDSPARPSSSKPAPLVKEEEEDDDDGCQICLDAKQSVKFSPCNHGACTDCVTRMRKEVIYKADKGMKCPFCRQFIEHHKNVGTTGDSKAKQALKDANQAAKAAALARQTQGQQRRVLDQEPEAAVPGRWQCVKCKDSNPLSAKMCTRCRNVAPLFVLQQLSSSKGPQVDLMKANPKAIQEYARAKLHPNLNSAFAEVGMPFDLGSATSGGTEETVAAAIKAGTVKKLQRVLEAFLSNDDCKELALDFYGNYTLQDIIGVISRLRTVARKMLKDKAISKADYDTTLGLVRHKHDYLQRIVIQISKIVSLLEHPRGNYVLEKLIDLVDYHELVTLTTPIFVHIWDHIGPEVRYNKIALVKIVKAVDRLNTIAFEHCPEQEECAQHLNKLCSALLSEPDHFKRLLLHDLGGPVVLDAAQGGLPYPAAIKVLDEVAHDVRHLRNSPAGVAVLKKFMSLESRNSDCRENFITQVCVMAQELSPNYAETASPKNGGPDIMQRMLELLNQEEDEICDDWVLHIVQLLVDSASTLCKAPGSKKLLIYGLDLPSVADFVPNHLEDIRQSCGEEVYRSIRGALSQHAAEQAPAPEEAPRGSEPPDPTPFEILGSPLVNGGNGPQVASSAASPQGSGDSAEIIDTTGFTAVTSKSKKKKKGAKEAISSAPAAAAVPLQQANSQPIATGKAHASGGVKITRIPSQNAAPIAAQVAPVTVEAQHVVQPSKKGSPYQIPHKKLKDLPGEAIDGGGSPAGRVGDPLYLRSWRPNSPNANKFVETTAQAANPVGTQLPNKIPSQAPKALHVETIEDDDFTNDFLADLLPGLVLGGSAKQEPVAATEPFKPDQNPIQVNRMNGGPTALKPYAPPTAGPPPGMSNGTAKTRTPYNPYNPMNKTSPSPSAQPSSVSPTDSHVSYSGSPMQNGPNGYTPSFPPGMSGRQSEPASMIVTPMAPGQARSAARPIQQSRASSLKADAMEFQPGSSRGSSPNARSLSAGAQPFKPGQKSSLGSGSAGKAGLKPDAPTFLPRSSATGDEVSRISSVSSMASITTSASNIIEKQKQATDEVAWNCPECTFRHEGAEAKFLTCALCFKPRFE